MSVRNSTFLHPYCAIQLKPPFYFHHHYHHHQMMKQASRKHQIKIKSMVTFTGDVFI